MPTFGNARATYSRDDVMTASPVQLVVRVLGAGVSALGRAAELADQNPPAARRQVSRAHAVVTELLGALDRERGGEIAVRLNSLYDYILIQLLRPSRVIDRGRIQLAAELLGKIKEAFDVVHASGAERAR